MYAEAYMIRGGGKAMPVYIRGDPANPGEWVAKGFLELFSDRPRPADAKEAQEHNFSRLNLAEAIASPDNP